ncbi:hypothetical protein OUZ56_003165 [Daphnia magna]|uniref:Uncharacterized protein n=1 Tax=Daphnia magna TaxID=35525 RepID=A0ABR0A7Y2_9CRUS|nr:hypothetical protein OUZ56_003165 [Daphnia magna]
MKATGCLAVGTAAMISQPKLPIDNLMLVETIETYLAKKTEMEISPKVLLATISGYSKKSNGRVEMGNLKEKLCKELESSQQQEKLRVEYKEAAKKKVEEESRRKKNAAEELKKRSVKDPKRKREFLKEGHGGTAKKRLVYDDVLPTPSILQHRGDHYSSLDVLFAEKIISGTPTVLQTTATPHVDSTALSRNTPNISSRTHEIIELKQRVSDLETENGFLFHQIDEKDLKISSLKAEVQLVQGHNMRIEKSGLKFAITIGRISKSNLHPMINEILESIYTRAYMSEHLLYGKAPRLSTAHQIFMVQAWKTYHGDVIQPKQVREAIRSKHSTETRALQSAMLTPPPEPASRAQCRTAK